MTFLEEVSKPLNARVWQREDHEHYVEPAWCSMRLFEEERFSGTIYDPACGFGNVVKSAQALGMAAFGTDLVDRGFDILPLKPVNFFDVSTKVANIVTNPPFKIIENFTLHALSLALVNVAIIMPTARLNAAHWIRGTPLRRIWLMTPRPSMPPGHVIAAGGKPEGGKVDYCWLVFQQGWQGHAETRWLRRDAA